MFITEIWNEYEDRFISYDGINIFAINCNFHTLNISKDAYEYFNYLHHDCQDYDGAELFKYACFLECNIDLDELADISLDQLIS